jgi:hypothetical protein
VDSYSSLSPREVLISGLATSWPSHLITPSELADYVLWNTSSVDVPALLDELRKRARKEELLACTFWPGGDDGDDVDGESVAGNLIPSIYLSRLF